MPILVNTLSMEAIQIVTIQSVVYVLRECVWIVRYLGILFPVNTIFEVTKCQEKNGNKHTYNVTGFLSCKECTDFEDDAAYHIPNIENTRDRTLKLGTCPMQSQCVITQSCGSPHTTRLSPIKLKWQINTTWQMQSIRNCSQWSSVSFPMSLPFCKLYHSPFLSA